MGYLRLVTHSGIMSAPMSPTDALANIDSLLSLPHVRSPGEEDGFWQVFRATAGRQPRGNDIPDAHLAALMRQHGVGVIYTRDRDFRRFPGIRVEDPFE